MASLKYFKPINNEKNLLVVDADDLESAIRSVVSQLLNEREAAQEERFLNVDNVCEKLSVSKPTLWRWEKSRYLIPVRFGTRVRYKESDIKKILEERA